MPPKFTICFILLLITLVSYVRPCELDQLQFGCRIHNAQCNCAYGCKSEFRYDTQENCRAALRGKRDICTEKKPCKNGTCSQITGKPGYECRCQGSGFYGAFCEKACPLKFQLNMPVECIQI